MKFWEFVDRNHFLCLIVVGTLVSGIALKLPAWLRKS
jgi:hypothetical protein